MLKVPTSGGALTVLAENQIALHAIAVDDTSVYWTCPGEGAIKKTAK